MLKKTTAAIISLMATTAVFALQQPPRTTQENVKAFAVGATTGTLHGLSNKFFTGLSNTGSLKDLKNPFVSAMQYGTWSFFGDTSGMTARIYTPRAEWITLSRYPTTDRYPATMCGPTTAHILGHGIAQSIVEGSTYDVKTKEFKPGVSINLALLGAGLNYCRNSSASFAKFLYNPYGETLKAFRK